jgi:hypothetical protein
MPAPTNLDLETTLTSTDWEEVSKFIGYMRYNLKAPVSNSGIIEIGIGPSSTEVAKLWELSAGEVFPETNFSMLFGKANSQNYSLFIKGNSADKIIGFKY